MDLALHRLRGETDKKEITRRLIRAAHRVIFLMHEQALPHLSHRGKTDSCFLWAVLHTEREEHDAAAAMAAKKARKNE